MKLTFIIYIVCLSIKLGLEKYELVLEKSLSFIEPGLYEPCTRKMNIDRGIS